ncbi:MAG: alkaline phosphatase family protein [Candidatus Nanohaloarchaea archaeon]
MKVLVVAFDGMDYELMKKFDLDNIPQEHFDTFDNKRGMKTVITCELFVSMITGKTHEEHGVVGIKTEITSGWRSKVADILAPEWARNNIRGFHRFGRLLDTVLERKERHYLKEDYNIDTLFEKIDGSRALFVPGYNTSEMVVAKAYGRLMNYGYSFDEKQKAYERFGFRARKQELFDDMKRIGARPLLFAHFHSPDMMQHKYGDTTLDTYDEKEMRRKYMELDNLAGDIKEKAEEAGYDVIIFFSDHGRPYPSGEHNQHAMYSSNFPLFDDVDNPHITDFHDVILDFMD